MALFRRIAALILATSCGLASANLVDLTVTRGVFDRFNPQNYDQLQFSFDDSAGAAAVPLSNFAAIFGVVTGYAGTLRSLDFGYTGPVFIGFTAADVFMIYEPCGPLLPSPASQCYVLSVTPTAGLTIGIDPSAPNALGGYLDAYLGGLLNEPNAGLWVSVFEPPNFNQGWPDSVTSRTWTLAVAPDSTAVPEPSSLALAALAGIGVAASRRRQLGKQAPETTNPAEAGSIGPGSANRQSTRS